MCTILVVDPRGSNGREKEEEEENDRPSLVYSIVQKMKDHEKEMQEVWADAYDAWVDVPGSSERTLYFAPINSPAPSTQLPLPDMVSSSVMFALTGWNPLGVETEPKLNVAANEKMKRTLDSLDPVPSSLWHGFGFSHDRKEDGFVCAFDRKLALRAEMALVQIAKDFNQGAIYRFDVIDGEKVTLCRRTIHACMSGSVEANVMITRCKKPDFLDADPKHLG